MKIIAILFSLFLFCVCASAPDRQDALALAISDDSEIVAKATNSKTEKINAAKQTENADGETLIDPAGQTLLARIKVPSGYKRVQAGPTSYGHFLRNLPMQPHGSEVKMFDGSTKSNTNIYVAVVDQEIGKRDLHQCADAVMRLRAEHLWKQKAYDRIHFNFTNGFRVDYSEWMKGKRISIKGNKTAYYQKQAASNTYKDFWSYMEIVFSYAGTLSLSRELDSVAIEDMKIGDVFIEGGSPGHAILVADMALHEETGETIFLLAQSYMPAQQTQILVNPANPDLSPWYTVNFGKIIDTPEWYFNRQELMRFRD